MPDTRQPIMQMLSPYDSNMMLPPADAFNTRQQPQEQPPPYQPQATISKSSKPVKAVSPTHTKVVTNSQVFSKSLDNVYQNYPQMNDASNVLPRIEDALHSKSIICSEFMLSYLIDSLINVVHCFSAVVTSV